MMNSAAEERFGTVRAVRGDAFPTVHNISEREFDALRHLIYRECGVVIKPHKKSLLVNRLSKRLRHLGLATFSDYLDFLKTPRGGKGELTELIDAVTTNKTDFFREPKHFDFLRDHMLPGIKNRVLSGGPCRIWSAASSSGEEPYTLAICLSEFFGTGPGNKFEILGTDISETVLRHAVAGLYREAAVQPIPRHLLLKYFDKRGNLYRAKPEIARRVTFRKLNLLHDFQRYLRNIDAVFLRNVLIYFDRATQEGIIQKIGSVLRPGGYLFIGHSESLQGMRTPFEYAAPSIYRRP